MSKTSAAARRHLDAELDLLRLVAGTGTITVSSLRRVARALECDLVYYLAPKDTLEASVRNQARKQLERDGVIPVGAVEIDELVAQRVDRPGLWSDPSSH
jgi:hypothetical protein